MNLSSRCTLPPFRQVGTYVTSRLPPCHSSDREARKRDDYRRLYAGAWNRRIDGHLQRRLWGVAPALALPEAGSTRGGHGSQPSWQVFPSFGSELQRLPRAKSHLQCDGEIHGLSHVGRRRLGADAQHRGERERRLLQGHRSRTGARARLYGRRSPCRRRTDRRREPCVLGAVSRVVGAAFVARAPHRESQLHDHRRDARRISVSVESRTVGTDGARSSEPPPNVAQLLGPGPDARRCERCAGERGPQHDRSRHYSPLRRAGRLPDGGRRRHPPGDLPHRPRGLDALRVARCRPVSAARRVRERHESAPLASRRPRTRAGDSTCARRHT